MPPGLAFVPYNKRFDANYIWRCPVPTCRCRHHSDRCVKCRNCGASRFAASPEGEPTEGTPQPATHPMRSSHPGASAASTQAKAPADAPPSEEATMRAMSAQLLSTIAEFEKLQTVPGAPSFEDTINRA